MHSKHLRYEKPGEDGIKELPQEIVRNLEAKSNQWFHGLDGRHMAELGVRLNRWFHELEELRKIVELEAEK